MGALAPKRYKRSVVTGFVYRIHRACSTWPHFHQSLEKAKRILEQNQYPPAFYDPLIRQTLQDILVEKEQSQEKQTPDTNTQTHTHTHTQTQTHTHSLMTTRHSLTTSTHLLMTT